MARSSSAEIELDGGYGEGGGALFRTALAMATLTQQSLKLVNIRGGTKHPGMDIEDCLILAALQSSSAAEVVGGEPGSQSIVFRPKRTMGPVQLRQEKAKQRTRGANGLVVLGALLPVLARSGVYSSLTVYGETYGPNTLTYDYFANVTVSAARKMGLYCFPKMEVSGFGRENYGEVHFEVEPSALRGLNWPERGPMKVCRAMVVSSLLPSAIAARGMAHLERLALFSGLEMQIETLDVAGSSPGITITAWAEFEGGLGGVANVGVRGVRVETIAQGAFESLSTFITSQSTVDAHLADQVLLIAAFAEGDTLFTVPRITRRLLTMIWVIKQFIPMHITVMGGEGEPGQITMRRG